MTLKNFLHNLSAINFSKYFKFPKFISFDEEQIVRSSFLMKSSFSLNQIFNKKRNSYDSFFIALCLTASVVDITFITLLSSYIYVCTTSYRLFNVSGKK